MTPIISSHSITLSYEQTVRIAEQLAAEFPHKVSIGTYFTDALDGTARPECITAHIITRAGFKAPQTWWRARRNDGKGNYSTASRRMHAHIRFLSEEIFDDEDVWRLEFLTKLQTVQDRGIDWLHAVRVAKSHVEKLKAREAVQRARQAAYVKSLPTEFPPNSSSPINNQ